MTARKPCAWCCAVLCDIVCVGGYRARSIQCLHLLTTAHSLLSSLPPSSPYRARYQDLKHEAAVALKLMDADHFDGELGLVVMRELSVLTALQ